MGFARFALISALCWAAVAAYQPNPFEPSPVQMQEAYWKVQETVQSTISSVQKTVSAAHETMKHSATLLSKGLQDVELQSADGQTALLNVVPASDQIVCTGAGCDATGVAECIQSLVDYWTNAALPCENLFVSFAEGQGDFTNWGDKCTSCSATELKTRGEDVVTKCFDLAKSNIERAQDLLDFVKMAVAVFEIRRFLCMQRDGKFCIPTLANIDFDAQVNEAWLNQICPEKCIPALLTGMQKLDDLITELEGGTPDPAKNECNAKIGLYLQLLCFKNQQGQYCVDIFMTNDFDVFDSPTATDAQKIAVLNAICSGCIGPFFRKAAAIETFDQEHPACRDPNDSGFGGADGTMGLSVEGFERLICSKDGSKYCFISLQSTFDTGGPFENVVAKCQDKQPGSCSNQCASALKSFASEVGCCWKTILQFLGGLLGGGGAMMLEKSPAAVLELAAANLMQAPQTCTTTDGMFDCGDGNSVSCNLFCDGTNHCPNGADEPNGCTPPAGGGGSDISVAQLEAMFDEAAKDCGVTFKDACKSNVRDPNDKTLWGKFEMTLTICNIDPNISNADKTAIAASLKQIWVGYCGAATEDVTITALQFGTDAGQVTCLSFQVEVRFIAFGEAGNCASHFASGGDLSEDSDTLADIASASVPVTAKAEPFADTPAVTVEGASVTDVGAPAPLLSTTAAMMITLLAAAFALA